MSTYPTDYFLAANSTQGFLSRFDQLGSSRPDWRTVIIKGVPGCGKSTLMQQVARRMTEVGERVERIHCSSDPASLDGLILEDLHVSIADGTAPHVLEPRYPCACERVLNLLDAVDPEVVYDRRKEIISLFDQNTALYQRAYRFFSAAGALQSDSIRFGAECLDLPKVQKTALRLARQTFLPARTHLTQPGPGPYENEKQRFLSAFGKDGVVFFDQTVQRLCSRVYLLMDESCCPAKHLLSSLRTLALSAKLPVISCYCPLRPYDKLEHLLLPEAGVAFVTANSLHKPELSPAGVIHCRRFLSPELLRARKQKLSFNRKAVRELLQEGQQAMGEAKRVHDRLEQCYRSAVDFSVVEQKTEELLDFLEIARSRRSAP